MHKKLTASLMAATALILAGCGTTHSGWQADGPDFIPARLVRPTPIELLPADQARKAVPFSKKGASRKRLKGAAAVAAANKASTRGVDAAEMCDFAWCIPNFNLNQTHLVPVQNGEFLEIKLPPDERAIPDIGMGSIGDMVPEPMVIQGIDSDTVAIKPETLDRPGDAVIFAKSGKSFRFRLVPSGTALKRIEILGTRDTPAVAGAESMKPAELVPIPPFTPLALVPLDGAHLPPGAPFNAWTDQRRMVVEMPADFPRPTFLAGRKGEAVVAYQTIEYISRGGAKIAAYATMRPITEAVLAGDGWRVLVTSDRGKLERRGRWLRAARLPEIAPADLALDDEPARRRGGIMPADMPLDGNDGGVFADEIDAIIEQNRRRKLPIGGPIPGGIPAEEIKKAHWG